VVVVDLFQRMDVPKRIPTGADDSEDYQPLSTDLEKDHYRLDAIKKYRDTFRSPSQPEGPAVVLISEIRKGDGARRELTHESLLGAGRLASDADTILLLWPTDDSRGDCPVVPVTLRIDKGRDGVVRRRLHLQFHHTCSTFTESEEADPRPPAIRDGSTPRGLAIDPLATGRC
jgi:hypothetical protein